MIRIIDSHECCIEHRPWTFCRRNINRIASDYDACVVRYEPDIEMAMLKNRFNIPFFVEIDRRGCPNCRGLAKR